MKIKMKKMFGIILSLVLVLGLMPWTSLTAYAVEPDLTMDDLVRAVGSASFTSVYGSDKLIITARTGELKLTCLDADMNQQTYNAVDFEYASYYGRYCIEFSGLTPYYLVLDNDNYITAFVETGSEDNKITGRSEKPFEKSVTNYTVTYKVVNGTWDGTSTADKTETVASGGNPASVPKGMMANSGYTGGSWDTDPSTATISADTTFTYTFVAKEAATVIKAPTANTFTYNGKPQELVTAGKAEGGEMQYALGTDAKTAPTDGYSEAIPTGTEAGTYYVWYKVVGDEKHKDSEPACIEVQIKEKKEETNNDSTIETKVEKKDDTPEAKVEGLDSELAQSVMNDDEKAKAEAGDNVSLTLEMTNIDSSVPEEEKNLTDNALKNENKNSKVGMFFDISLWLKVGQGKARQVTETGKKVITVTLQVPVKFKAPAGVKRNFYVIHIHNKAAKVIAKTTSMSIPLSLDGFSTFALAYADEMDEAETEAAANDIFFSGVKINQKDGKIVVSWDKTKGVAKYEVYATYCGNKYPKKATATTKKNSVTLKKINSKKINFKKNFKLYVVAYDSDGNKVGKTVSAHFAGKDNKKYKNIKELKLSTKTITVAVGKTSKIKASTVLEKGKKKALSENHAAKFRYKTTNANVAKVNKSGKVTGVSAGTCHVYVYSQNGLAKKCKVTVK